MSCSQPGLHSEALYLHPGLLSEETPCKVEARVSDLFHFTSWSQATPVFLDMSVACPSSGPHSTSPRAISVSVSVSLRVALFLHDEFPGQ